MTNAFLVYEHWRPDTGSCFYVGKGKRKRSRSFETRNSRYGRIVAKLRRLGLSPEIRIVRDGLTEAEAIALEIVTIAQRKSDGFQIANYTEGGDGTSGYVHTEATKATLRKRRLGRKWSPEMREIMKQVVRTVANRTPESRAKHSASAKIAQKARFKKVKRTRAGRIELNRKMTAMARKAAADPAICALRSANAKALWADPAYQEKMRNRRVPKSIVKGFS